MTGTERTLPADDLQPLREVLRTIEVLNKLGGLGHEKHAWLDTAGDTLQAWIAAHGNKPTENETRACLTREEEIRIGQAQGELAVLKKDARAYNIRRIAGQALEVVTFLRAKVTTEPPALKANVGKMAVKEREGKL